MGPPSYMRSVVDRNVVLRRMTVEMEMSSNTLFLSSEFTFLSCVAGSVQRVEYLLKFHSNFKSVQARYTRDICIYSDVSKMYELVFFAPPLLSFLWNMRNCRCLCNYLRMGWTFSSKGYVP
jgi:hypothetical protein